MPHRITNALVPVLGINALASGGMVAMQSLGNEGGALAIGYAASIATTLATVATVWIRHRYPLKISRRTSRRENPTNRTPRSRRPRRKANPQT